MRRKLAAALLVLSGTFLVIVLLLIVIFQSHPPRKALAELAVALQNNNQVEIRRLSTPGGLVSLQAMASRYGQKRLGHYLASHRLARPTSHVFFHIIVFILEEEKTPPVTVFFKWTWNGWKLTSINGTPPLPQSQRLIAVGGEL